MVMFAKDFTEEKAKKRSYPCYMCTHGHPEVTWLSWGIMCLKCIKKEHDAKPSEFKLFKPENKTAHNNPITPLIDSRQTI